MVSRASQVHHVPHAVRAHVLPVSNAIVENINPAVTAASAVVGRIASPAELDVREGQE